jgi:hypothetical protein
MKLNRRHAAQACLVVSLFGLGWSVARSLPLAQESDDYDIELAASKLGQIGRALQIYRQEFGYKPVEERRRYWDAGLPPSLTVLAEPGHAWSLKDGIATFKMPRIRYGNPAFITFAFTYNQDHADMPELDPFLVSRGEALPILIDENVTPRADFFDRESSVALALRLNGQVDLITFRPGKELDVLRK